MNPEDKKETNKNKKNKKNKKMAKLILLGTEGLMLLLLLAIFGVSYCYFGKALLTGKREDATTTSDGTVLPTEVAQKTEPEETATKTIPDKEYETDAPLPKDPVIKEETGVYAILQKEEGSQILFSTNEPYPYEAAFLKDRSDTVTFYNYTEEAVEVSLLLSDESHTVTEIGGRVDAKNQISVSLQPESDMTATPSLILRKSAQVEAHIASAVALEHWLLQSETGEQTVYLYGTLSEYEALLEELPYETNLWWDRNAPSQEELSLICSVSMYNGKAMETTYGGSGQASITNATILRSENGWTDVDLVASVVGNTITVLVPYYLNEAGMHTARLSVATTEGSVSYTGEGLNADGTIDLWKETGCIVTDAAGNTRTYRLRGDRAKHNLPVVYMTTATGGEVPSAYTFIEGTFRMDANGVEGVSDIDTLPIQIRGRGNSTWERWPKHSMKIVFEEKQKLVGSIKDRDWAMIANYYDRTMERNELAYALSEHLEHLEYTPDYQFVDVFLNGAYYGVYDLGATIEVGKNNVDIKLDESQVDCGFLLEIGGSGKKSTIYAGGINNIEIHAPTPVTDAQYNYIANYIAQMSNAIQTRTNYEDYMDVDSFIDWLILEEFCYNWDAGYIRNVYMYKEPGGKMKFGPVWDFDLSMGSVGYDDWTYQTWATSQNGLIDVTWTTYLLQDPAFVERMKNRWLEKREELRATVDTFLDEEYPILNPSWEENHWRWMADKDGVNIQWEWIFEYEGTTLDHYNGYLKRVFDYRYEFLNKTLVDGWVCPPKPPKESKEASDAGEEEEQEK